jgi:hypothetical protein
MQAHNGYLDVMFPDGEWAVSGLVVKGPRPREPLPQRTIPKGRARPAIEHVPPKSAVPGQALALAIRVAPTNGVNAIRLHYRPLNQLAKFKVLENRGAKGSFAIPAEDVSNRWDLMYYFEILTDENGGWFQPDPHTATPYYVVTVEAPPSTTVR